MARPRAAKKKETHTLPEEMEEEYPDRPEEWVRAYSHAINNNCTPKAAALFAEAHSQADEFADGETT